MMAARTLLEHAGARANMECERLQAGGRGQRRVAAGWGQADVWHGRIRRPRCMTHLDVSKRRRQPSLVCVLSPPWRPTPTMSARASGDYPLACACAADFGSSG